MSQFERTPCRTDIPALRDQEAEVIRPEQWRERALSTPESREAAEARKAREELAAERADRIYRRSQLPWPFRVALGFWDAWCDWRNGRRP